MQAQQALALLHIQNCSVMQKFPCLIVFFSLHYARGVEQPGSSQGSISQGQNVAYGSVIHMVETGRRQRKPKSAKYRDAWNLILQWATREEPRDV